METEKKYICIEVPKDDELWMDLLSDLRDDSDGAIVQWYNVSNVVTHVLGARVGLVADRADLNGVVDYVRKFSREEGVVAATLYAMTVNTIGRMITKATSDEQEPE
jgi:hypothetical protein